MFDFGFADIILVALGGLLILYSYSRLKKPGLARYTDHPLWLGLPRGLVLLLSGLQVLAAVGFLAAFFSWVANPPEEAETWPIRIVFISLLLNAAIWPFATLVNAKVLTVLSLLGTAVASGRLLLWSLMEANQRWWVVAGFSALCLVTIGADGIVWNGLYVYKQWTQPEYFSAF
jgi:hypothetical protein